MEDVIYGVILRANILILSSDPPVIASKKFIESPAAPNKLSNTPSLTPERGSELQVWL